ncbi:MAG: hypothetical protein OSB05_01845 [Akkermansiaceae bacterium]|nr:hypothetical protein [Akkermansiaceae bacterium]
MYSFTSVKRGQADILRGYGYCRGFRADTWRSTAQGGEPLVFLPDRAGLNAPLDQFGLYALNKERSLRDHNPPDNIEDSSLIEWTLKPRCKEWGAATYLTQAGVLQTIGPGISVRADTCAIRAYSEAMSEGKVKTRVWCEVIVQRLPDPIRPDSSGINPDRESEFSGFGRRFKIKSFRWLNTDEV